MKDSIYYYWVQRIFISIEGELMSTKSQQCKLVIHGGAGALHTDHFTPSLEKNYHQVLKKSLLAGYKVLSKNGSSLDAVIAAVKILENSPLFNAGYGSVLTQNGTVELDASIMDGTNLKAGTVAGISRIKNPVLLARLIMEQSKHVMLIGKRAELFAKKQGMPLIDAQQLITKKQFKRWQTIKAKATSDHKFGTVGAVALDHNDHLAAATSTGGIMNKLPGRVGDSAVIGAGTYANNNYCAISGTGQGELFMRLLLSYDVAAQMMYKNASLEQAGTNAIQKLTDIQGKGGIIALDHLGNHIMLFNTECMYRGFIDAKNLYTYI